jgi:hypothetical protein
LSAHARTYGNVRCQLMQVYVQKSINTTFPRSDSAVSGAELSHAVAPEKEGNMRSVDREAFVGPTPFCAIAGSIVVIEPTRNATTHRRVSFNFMNAPGKTRAPRS